MAEEEKKLKGKERIAEPAWVAGAESAKPREAVPGLRGLGPGHPGGIGNPQAADTLTSGPPSSS